MYYWRAAVKHSNEKNYSIVYFSTEHINYVVDVQELLESYGLQTHNSFFRRLNIIEYISNILTCPVSTVHTFQKYGRSTLIG